MRHLLAVALALGGCGPSMPEEAEARAWLAARQARVDALRTGLAAELTAIEGFGERRDEGECQARASDLEGLAAQARCMAARRDRTQARDDGVRRVAEDWLPAAVRRASALGADVTYEVEGDALRSSLGSVPPAPPGYRGGTVRAEDGVAIEGGELGWGLYQTAHTVDGVQRGDGDYHPGIEVQQRFEVRDAEVTLRVFFLTD